MWCKNYWWGILRQASRLVAFPVSCSWRGLLLSCDALSAVVGSQTIAAFARGFRREENRSAQKCAPR